MYKALVPSNSNYAGILGICCVKSVCGIEIWCAKNGEAVCRHRWTVEAEGEKQKLWPINWLAALIFGPWKKRKKIIISAILTIKFNEDDELKCLWISVRCGQSPSISEAHEQITDTIQIWQKKKIKNFHSAMLPKRLEIWIFESKCHWGSENFWVCSNFWLKKRKKNNVKKQIY